MCQTIQLQNESQSYMTDIVTRKCYVYDFYLQLSLTTVNGKSLKRMLSTQ